VSNSSSISLHNLLIVDLSACFAGSRIVLRQVSLESEPIYDFIIALHKHTSGDYASLSKSTGVSSSDIDSYLNYATQFLGNLGNFKSFGDSKFLPRIEPAQLKALAGVSPKTQELYEKFKDAIYAGNDVGKLHLGYPSAGHVSTYYPDSPDITQEEIAGVSDFLESKGLLPENTRVKKTGEGFEILIASALDNPSAEQRDLKESEWTLDDGKKVKLVFGDHPKEMETIANHLEKAKGYAANDNESRMMEEYVKSFQTGSLEAFKESQRYWIRNTGPEVETDIGFVETYRDPHGIRGEWEGFVATVNKERTKAFGSLVDAAPKLIPLLPWSKDFEKDKFLSPDFTSLEVLTFAGSG
jgi:dipeptidyl-peptidase-3